MDGLVFITGNQHKADYLAKWLGLPVAHHKLDLEELQTFDLHKLVDHKVRQAYEHVQKPVLVEDVSLTLTAAGHLPGTFIKWFLEELGLEGLCRFADGLAHRKAVVSICYGLYDGRQLHFFDASIEGEVTKRPRGDQSFGWNAIFLPDGATKTYGEMTDDELRPFSHRAKAIEKLQEHLQRSDANGV